MKIMKIFKINDFFFSMWLGQQVIKSLKTNEVKICRGALKYFAFSNICGWAVEQ